MPDSLLLYCCRANIFKSNIRSFYFFFKYSFLSKITFVGPLSCALRRNINCLNDVNRRNLEPQNSSTVYRQSFWLTENCLISRVERITKEYSSHALSCVYEDLIVRIAIPRLIPTGPVNVVYSCVVRHQLIAFPCSLCNPKLTLRKLFRNSWPRSKKNSLSIAKPLTATISIHPISFRSGQNLPWNPSYSLSIYTLYSCIDVWRLLTSWTNRLVIPSRILFKTFVMCKSEPIKFIPRDNNTYNSQHVIP